MMTYRRFFGSTVLLGAILVGCSTSTPAAPTSCLGDLTACPTGQTCWPVSAAPTFSCIASEPKGAFGVACQNSIGIATCADGLACDAVADAGEPRCTYYCDVAKGKACPPNYDCRVTQAGGANGVAIQICRASSEHGSPVPGVDAGEPGFVEDASPGDAGFDAAPSNQ